MASVLKFHHLQNLRSPTIGSYTVLNILQIYLATGMENEAGVEVEEKNILLIV
jgi:hypothetical protein